MPAFFCRIHYLLLQDFTGSNAWDLGMFLLLSQVTRGVKFQVQAKTNSWENMNKSVEKQQKQMISYRAQGVTEWFEE